MNPHTRARTLLLACTLTLALAMVLSLSACTTTSPQVIDSPASQLNEANELAKQAQAKDREGKLDEAISIYQQAVRVAPTYAPGWHNMGVLLMRRGNNLDAATAFQVAAENDLTDPRPYTAMGMLAQELLHYDEAAKYYTKALERSDRYLPALRKSIEVDQLRDKYDDTTLQRIRRAVYLETDPQWKTYLLNQKIKAEQRISRSAG